MTLHPTVKSVTSRIIDRSRLRRGKYLERVVAASAKGPQRFKRGCANRAHGFAACDPLDKRALRSEPVASLGIVTAYNDMLSAHQPYEHYPVLIRDAARRVGAVAQVAGGVPAMCDGITQGEAGMELSLFSRDVIALSTALALSHQTFDAALYLGICDKIVPGLLIGALSFGHLPAIFVPSGPMVSGMANDARAKVRQLYAEGKVTREALLDAEAKSYHGPGTCTFYGTANTNQMLMEVMGLHIPGTSFVNPNTPLRDALTAEAVARAVAISNVGREYTPLAEILDERAFVNGMVGLLATGGSTNHTIHLIAIAAAAGICLEWGDMADLARVVPLLTKIYPNGKADVNQFHAAGGMGFLVRQLIDNGLLHVDVRTVAGGGLAQYAMEPMHYEGTLRWVPAPACTLDDTVLRPASEPFSRTGGLALLTGNLGSSIAKLSAVSPAHHIVEAPARVFDSQDAVVQAFQGGALTQDVVVVLHSQGPRANGMPELHKLMPILGILQDRGLHVALVTDGRLSGASGKVPAAIHVTPEGANGGAIARIRDGDVIRLDLDNGSLNLVSADDEWLRRPATVVDRSASHHGVGRDLFQVFRANVTPADAGATIFAGVNE